MSEYKGYDWSELSVEFGLVNEDKVEEVTLDDEADKQLLEDTKSYIEDESDREYVENECRKYIKAMINCEYNSVDDPVWKGLLEIDNTEEFLKFFKSLLGYAWT